MQVLIAFDGSIEEAGGAERFAINMISVYERLGHKAILLCFSNRPNGQCITISTIKLLNRSLFTRSLNDFRRLIVALKYSDLVHILYCESLILLLIAIIARLQGKKVISSPLASITHLFHHNKLKAVFAPFFVTTKVLIALLSDVVHVASLHDFIYIRKLLWKKEIFLIPHGINIPSKTGQVSFRELRNYDVKLCFLGRFSEDKGSLVILEALRKLRNEKVNAYLIIIGPKIYALNSLIDYGKKYGSNALRNIIPYVQATGYLCEEDKYELLSMCDVGIISSISDPVEAFSIALSEFNFMSVPVVASAVGALKTRLRSYAGVLVKPKDPEDLARGILQALQLKGRVKKLPDTIIHEQEVELWALALEKLLRS